jgi:hypothetical protein
MPDVIASPSAAPHVPRSTDGNLDRALEVVRESLRGLKYGSVVISVQDGRVVQVERSEKRRL